MKSYPVEYRRRVIELREQNWSSVRIAEALGVSRAWVDSIRRLHAAGQPLAPKSRANKRKSLAEREGDRLKARVAAKPGSTLADLKKDLGLKESIWAVWLALKALKISLKKKRSTPENGPGPTSSWPGPRGRSSKPGSTPAGSSSSTRRSAPPR